MIAPFLVIGLIVGIYGASSSCPEIEIINNTNKELNKEDDKQIEIIKQQFKINYPEERCIKKIIKNN